VPESSDILHTDEPESGRMRRVLASFFTQSLALGMRDGYQAFVDRTIHDMIAAGPQRAAASTSTK
jgi:hypothetical protein